jgi:hypothetical protein
MPIILSTPKILNSNFQNNVFYWLSSDPDQGRAAGKYDLSIRLTRVSKRRLHHIIVKMMCGSD